MRTREEIEEHVRRNRLAPSADVEKIINASVEIGADVRDRVAALGEYSHSYNWPDAQRPRKQEAWEYAKPWTAEEKTLLLLFLIEQLAEDARNTSNRPERDEAKDEGKAEVWRRLITAAEEAEDLLDEFADGMDHDARANDSDRKRFRAVAQSLKAAYGKGLAALHPEEERATL